MSLDRLDPAELDRLGRAAYGGDDPHPLGVTGLPPAALEGFGASVATLSRTAAAGGPWAVVGAFCIATTLVDEEQRAAPAYLDLADRAALVLRDDGVAYPSVPQPALRRWAQVHGGEGLRPAGWPSALERCRVPARGAEPRVRDLGRRESRRLAQVRADAASDVLSAEWSDGRVVAIAGGIDTADGIRRRRPWAGLEAAGYVAFLRALGERLVTPAHWAHEDLRPYFPCRARSRGEMRDEARRLREAAA